MVVVQTQTSLGSLDQMPNDCSSLFDVEGLENQVCQSM
jgi:hypothetical protein